MRDKVTIRIGSHKFIKLIAILFSMMSISLSTLLLLVPRWGPILGFILVALAFGWTVIVFRIKLILDDDLVLIHPTRAMKVSFDEIASLDKMRVIGTVANSPLVIRSVTLNLKNGTSTVLPTFWFGWREVLDLIETIEKRRNE
ncbi:MAG: hypothetical protein ACXAE3_00470 [Candidatus Kariarchaeaceae archaeon]|jgi:hypothetical protein